MTRIFSVFLLALAPLLAACPAGTAEAPRPGEPGVDALAGGENDAGVGPVCLGGLFVSEGTIPLPGEGAGDARRVGGLRWEAHDGCERFVIDLTGEDGEAPAGRVGRVTARIDRGIGVVRVSLPEVIGADADATELRPDGALAAAAYAVLAPEQGGVYVDLHLAAPAEAHATILHDPARLVVDLRPGGGALPTPAARSNAVVLLAPRAGDARYPITATGYARTFEANVVARLERDGRDVHESFTTSTGWVDGWGAFTLTVPEGPEGPVVLHVGEYSAKDGSWLGVAVPLEMRH